MARIHGSPSFISLGRIVRLGARWGAAVLILPAGLPRSALADRLILAEGLVLAGKVEKPRDDVYRITMPAGFLEIPNQGVAQVLTGASSYEEWIAREGRGGDHAADWVALSDWCRSVGYEVLARRYAERAFALDPTDESARNRMGYLRVGGLWVRAADPVGAGPDASHPKAEAYLSALSKAWYFRVRTIHEKFLVGEDPTRPFEAGRDLLLQSPSPLAVTPVCQILDGPSVRVRQLMAEWLGLVPGDEAVLQLVVLSVLDPAAEVRMGAISALAARRDARIREALVAGLSTRHEQLIRRCATVLGGLQDAAALPGLIDALQAESDATARPGVADWLADVEKRFARPAEIPLDDRVARLPSRIALPTLRDNLSLLDRESAELTGRFRTEAQEALQTLTGQNFGFDKDAWRRWLSRNPPLTAGPP